MVSQEQLKTEIDILSEKIETFEAMLKSGRSGQGGVNGWMSRKLAEYRAAYDKMTSSYCDLYGESGQQDAVRARHAVN